MTQNPREDHPSPAAITRTERPSQWITGALMSGADCAADRVIATARDIVPDLTLIDFTERIIGGYDVVFQEPLRRTLSSLQVVNPRIAAELTQRGNSTYIDELQGLGKSYAYAVAGVTAVYFALYVAGLDPIRISHIEPHFFNAEVAETATPDRFREFALDGVTKRRRSTGVNELQQALIRLKRKTIAGALDLGLLTPNANQQGYAEGITSQYLDSIASWTIINLINPPTTWDEPNNGGNNGGGGGGGGGRDDGPRYPLPTGGGDEWNIDDVLAEANRIFEQTRKGVLV